MSTRTFSKSDVRDRRQAQPQSSDRVTRLQVRGEEGRPRHRSPRQPGGGSSRRGEDRSRREDNSRGARERRPEEPARRQPAQEDAAQAAVEQQEQQDERALNSLIDEARATWTHDRQLRREARAQRHKHTEAAQKHQKEAETLEGSTVETKRELAKAEEDAKAAEQAVRALKAEQAEREKKLKAVEAEHSREVTEVAAGRQKEKERLERETEEVRQQLKRERAAADARLYHLLHAAASDAAVPYQGKAIEGWARLCYKEGSLLGELINALGDGGPAAEGRTEALEAAGKWSAPDWQPPSVPSDWRDAEQQLRRGARSRSRSGGRGGRRGDGDRDPRPAPRDRDRDRDRDRGGRPLDRRPPTPPRRRSPPRGRPRTPPRSGRDGGAAPPPRRYDRPRSRDRSAERGGYSRRRPPTPPRDRDWRRDRRASPPRVRRR
eukprot:TRINITY_DN69990_c0_g1_i1.p1 TRINITY_DN69990_c0_g1~~TRINITY_DN69990_c0_g1_i1.p1  ORF type:complete len:460 (+),score=111.69 TRINITY_DN69990_c0_g1_i1:78-1382(+)